MCEHYYGLPQYSLSQNDYVTGWMNSDGYAQVNAIRIAQDMPVGTHVMHLEGSSVTQIQSGYGAYQTSGRAYFSNQEAFVERGVDLLIYQGHCLGRQPSLTDFFPRDSPGLTAGVHGDILETLFSGHLLHRVWRLVR